MPGVAPGTLGAGAGDNAAAESVAVIVSLSLGSVIAGVQSLVLAPGLVGVASTALHCRRLMTRANSSGVMQKCGLLVGPSSLHDASGGAVIPNNGRAAIVVSAVGDAVVGQICQLVINARLGRQ